MAGSDSADASALSGCTVPPCGALNNKTDYQIGVRWTDNNGAWKYGVVQPHTTMGGYFNDGIDVDFWFIPDGCADHRNNPYMNWVGEQWAKISSNQTVVIDVRECNV